MAIAMHNSARRTRYVLYLEPKRLLTIFFSMARCVFSSRAHYVFNASPDRNTPWRLFFSM